MTGTTSFTDSADHAASAHVVHLNLAQKAKKPLRIVHRMQSNNSIFASVWHQSIAVLAVTLCSWNQGYKPCHLCLQVVNLQHHHLDISLRAAFTCSLEVQVASKVIKQMLFKARNCLFSLKSRKICKQIPEKLLKLQ